jgi:hypothetical protein
LDFEINALQHMKRAVLELEVEGWFDSIGTGSIFSTAQGGAGRRDTKRGLISRVSPSVRCHGAGKHRTQKLQTSIL